MNAQAVVNGIATKAMVRHTGIWRKSGEGWPVVAGHLKLSPALSLKEVIGFG
jgi:hypothetical protein